MRGIGNSIAAVITEIHSTGKSKVEALHEALGISNIDQLKEAIKSGTIRLVKGFSDKTAKNIAEAIESSENRAPQILLVDALEIGETLVDSNHSWHHYSPSFTSERAFIGLSSDCQFISVQTSKLRFCSAQIYRHRKLQQWI